MSKLWSLLIVSMGFAFTISYRDKRLCYVRQTPYCKDKLVTAFFALYLGVFCGLRTFYNDTLTYIQIYGQTPILSEFAQKNTFTYAQGIGFAYVNSILKTLGFSSQDYLMFYAVITAACYVQFVRKHTDNSPLAVFLMFTTGFYTFTFAAIKQCMAIAICLIGLEFLLNKKRAMYILFVGIASLFHPYAFIYLLLLFMDFRPMTFRTFFYIALFVAVGLELSRMIGTIVDVTSMMGANYDMSSFMGEGVNIFRVLVCLVPVGLMFLYGPKMFSMTSRTENILCNMAMLNGLIMFAGLFGTANYFGRLANYFLPAQVVVIPWMLKRIGRQDRLLLTTLCVVGYIGYFAYGNLVQSVFDDNFSKITLWQYIVAHLEV